MNILIIGYGKMGKELEQCLLLQGHTIAGIIDSETDRTEFRNSADCAIEFTTPQTAVENILWCMDRAIPVVTGTTGWYDQLPYISEQCAIRNGSVLWGSNFSIGMNVFFMLNKQLSLIMNRFKQYKPTLSETHHIHKADKPSGTAIILLQDIIKNSERYHSWSMDTSNTSEGVIPVHVQREDEIQGIHQISYASDFDILSIIHEAKSRKGFAMGAILAAQWLSGKKGLYSFNQFFEQFMNENTK